MSEKVLGVVKANRLRERKLIYETLFFTPDRVIMAEASGHGFSMLPVVTYVEAVGAARKAKKKEKEYHELSAGREVSAEDVLKAFIPNTWIRNSEITEVELKKGWLRKLKLKVIPTKDIYGDTKFEWNLMGLLPEKKGVKLEDCENILRPVFGDKLYVKK